MMPAKESRPVRADEAASDHSAGSGTIEASITRVTDILPWASCSVYTPAGRRELLQVAATCPGCGAVTVHRLNGPTVDGVTRQGACSHRYQLRTRRVYAPRYVGGAA